MTEIEKTRAFEARVAESLDALIAKFRDLGFNILGATCILSLDSGKVVTLSGGKKDISAIASSLVALIAIVDLLESADSLDSETRDLIAGLKVQINHYTKAIDARLPKHVPIVGRPDQPLH